MNTGLIPNTCFETKSADIAAVIVDNNTKGEKYLYISSNANITPANGALNAAARPAAPPLDISIFFSTLVHFNFLLTPSPTDAPNCIDGPSLPKDSPEPIDKTPPINL